MKGVAWQGEERLDGGVRERAFSLEHGGERLPGVAWLPEPPVRPGLVLFGHGYTVDKRSHFLVPWARRLAAEHGLASAAIDMPCHGERRTAPDRSSEQVAADYLGYWRENGGELIAAELRATAAALRDTGEVGPGPVGYWGLSLGTQYGTAYLASDPGVRAAVLGLYGLVGPRVAGWAAQLRCPVFFVRQQADEIHGHASAAALYDRLGSPDKQLHTNAGAHEAVPVATLRASLAWLALHL